MKTLRNIKNSIFVTRKVSLFDTKKRKMEHKTKHASFRLDPTTVDWIRDTASKHKVTQAELVTNMVAQAQSKEGLLFAEKGMEVQYSVKDKEGSDLLLSLGVGTASGWAGYHVAGWIRKQLELDEDKGMQVIIGLVAGLGTMLITALSQNKK